MGCYLDNDPFGFAADAADYKARHFDRPDRMGEKAGGGTKISGERRGRGGSAENFGRAICDGCGCLRNASDTPAGCCANATGTSNAGGDAERSWTVCWTFATAIQYTCHKEATFDGRESGAEEDKI